MTTKIPATMMADDVATQAELDAIKAQFVSTSGVTVANTVTETSMVGTGVGTVTLPANFWEVGKTLIVKVCGKVSFTGSPTGTIRLKLGGVTILSNAGSLPAGTFTDACFQMEFALVCRSTGATGTLFAQGFSMFVVSSGVASANYRGFVQASPATIDTTAPMALDGTYQWGTASTSNSLTAGAVIVERYLPA